MRLARRPRSWLAFAVAPIFHGLFCILLRIPAARELIESQLWRIQGGAGMPLSGLTTAAHILGDSMLCIGVFCLALVGGDIISQGAEDGTLRMTFLRPVSRWQIWLQRLGSMIIYTMVLCFFLGASALAVGLLFDRPGPLVMVAGQEGILGVLDFPTGLLRYAFAVGLLAVCILPVTLLAFFFSCLLLKPATATTLALSLVLADNVIRQIAAQTMIYPFCLCTRLLTWRQVFNDEIPWPRLERNLQYLAWVDLVLIVAAWLAFRRREFKG